MWTITTENKAFKIQSMVRVLRIIKSVRFLNDSTFYKADKN